MAQVEDMSSGGVIEAEAAPQMDYAPESFWLSKDAEMDWLDRNAFIERKDSGKASNSHSSSNLNASSNRYSKSKPSIIGLPKPSKTSYAEAKNRRPCKTATIRLFPKRSESVGSKSGAAMSEPSSPKVSCMGRVRSKKERSRRAKSRKKSSDPDKSIKPGFWTNFRLMFQPKSRDQKVKGDEHETIPSNRRPGQTVSLEAPGLGGVTRFASGRRSHAWAADLQGPLSEPLDKTGPIWQPTHVDCHSVPPASV